MASRPLRVRCAFLVLSAVLTGGFAPAGLAQDRPPAGSWKDPPSTPDGGASSAERRAKPAAEPRNAGAARADGTLRAVRRPAERRAERGRARRVAARKSRGSEAAERVAADMTRTERRERPRTYRMSMRRMRPYPTGLDAPPDYPLTRFRREGWGSLLSSRRDRRFVEAETPAGAFAPRCAPYPFAGRRTFDASPRFEIEDPE